MEHETGRRRQRGGIASEQTLTAQQKLIDPVWGGVYQYSTDGDWDHPHYEKIMQFQAENLAIYALAYARWHDEARLKPPTIFTGFSRFSAKPDGEFYTSMDADLFDGQHGGEYFKLDNAGGESGCAHSIPTATPVKTAGQFTG